MTPSLTISSATVTTDRPQRYGKQLVSHLSRRVTGEWDEASASGQLTFPSGRADLSCTPTTLVLRLEVPAGDLDRMEDVLGRHLVRFGARDELLVQWIRQGGAAGTLQRKADD
jgi:uncharacterized protein